MAGRGVSGPSASSDRPREYTHRSRGSEPTAPGRAQAARRQRGAVGVHPISSAVCLASPPSGVSICGQVVTNVLQVTKWQLWNIKRILIKSLPAVLDRHELARRLSQHIGVKLQPRYHHTGAAKSALGQKPEPQIGQTPPIARFSQGFSRRAHHIAMRKPQTLSCVPPAAFLIVCRCGHL